MKKHISLKKVLKPKLKYNQHIPDDIVQKVISLFNLGTKEAKAIRRIRFLIYTMIRKSEFYENLYPEMLINNSSNAQYAVVLELIDGIRFVSYSNISYRHAVENSGVDLSAISMIYPINIFNGEKYVTLPNSRYDSGL